MNSPTAAQKGLAVMATSDQQDLHPTDPAAGDQALSERPRRGRRVGRRRSLADPWLGERLRAIYEDVVQEDLPDDFAALIDALDAKVGDGQDHD